MPEHSDDRVKPNQRVFVYGQEDLGVGEVLRVCETGGTYQADVAFDHADGRRLHTFPLDRLQPARDPWQRIVAADLDSPQDFLLKQLAYQLPLANTGGELSNSRTALLPHQILLTRDVIAAYQMDFPDLEVRVVDNTRRSIPSAVNRAIEVSRGEFIVRLDAH